MGLFFYMQSALLPDLQRWLGINPAEDGMPGEKPLSLLDSPARPETDSYRPRAKSGRAPRKGAWMSGKRKEVA